jgi:undecaprenyl diphosphate synthase
LEKTLIRKDNSGLSESELLALIDRARVPAHVAIIMDGNGRWAARKGLPRLLGHKKGMEVVKDIIAVSSNLGIKALTLYAFSLENWRRPPKEVEALMSLLAIYLQKEIKMMMEKGIRFKTIGRMEDLPKEARAWVDKARAETAGNTGMVLNLALSYGGRWEMMEAAKRFAADAVSGKASTESLDEASFSGYMDTAGLPELDLLIRTSGEVRVSNFLLWQMAYAELYFTEALWPDFRARDLYEAILDYQGRQRRFGMTGEQLGRGNAV